jgi:L-ascorbate oxidase
MKNILLLLASISASTNALADTYNLIIDEKTVNITGTPTQATVINGTMPGPLLRFKEGEEVVINVTNNLDVDSSIHWHGLIVPWQMDGVPGISYDGIKPGETFTYKFTLEQNGTYWYHSHSAFQEQTGVHAPMIIEPAEADPVQYDRDYVVMLADWKDESPEEVYANLKGDAEYYTNPRPTVFDFIKEWFNADSGEASAQVVKERASFAKMRMAPTDIVDVTGFTFLMNGQTADKNWTGTFKAGERIRLRFINAAAATYFDISIPGLKMEVVQADGQNLQPVMIDQFNIAIAETYDVVVTPKEDIAYTVFAQAMDRSGYVRGTLAPKEGMTASIPEMLPRRVLTLKDVMPGMSMSGMDMDKATDKAMSGMQMDKSAKNMSGMRMNKEPAMNMPAMDSTHNSAKNSVKTINMSDIKMNMHASEGMGPKILSYDDLKSLEKTSFNAVADREITLRLTGEMDRYIWSFDDQKFDMAEPIYFEFGERVRVKFVNDTMMDHPIHMHGLWQELQNGSGDYAPKKHTINVPPKATIIVEVPVDNAGKWAFHCHILYHAAAGMFREIEVKGGEQ